MIRYAVIDSCPVPRRLAPRVRALKRAVPSARLQSCYRGRGARRLLHRLGKHTQAELYDGYRRGLAGYYPANPPGFSSHELRSDGNPVFRKPSGARLRWWQVGLDFNDAAIPALQRAASKRGWKLVRPYSTKSEYHHLNFAAKPKRWHR